MSYYDLTIAGMTCAHCVRGVSAALARVPGLVVEHVSVGHARVRASTTLAVDSIREAVEAGGVAT